MEHAIPSSQPVYLGSGVVPLIFVEVIPLSSNPSSRQLNPTNDATACLSAPHVKLNLGQRTLRSTFAQNTSMQIFWGEEASSGSMSAAETKDYPLKLTSGSLASLSKMDSPAPYWAQIQTLRRTVPVIYLPSDHPNHMDPCPCWVRGYGKRNPMTFDLEGEAIISDATLVRILPTEAAILLSDPHESQLSPTTSRLYESNELWKHRLTGVAPRAPLSPEMLDEVFHNHDVETVQALSLRMSLLLAQSVSIGTTADALFLQRKRRNRGRSIHGVLNAYCRRKCPERELPAPSTTSRDGSMAGDNKAAVNVPFLLREGALIVHSPDHGAGKTLLVQAIAQRQLKCDAVHIIQPGALLAQYGAHTDAALESLLHSVVISAACRQRSVCIVLDHMDAMLPPKLSGRTSAGDAAVPVLNAIASYLKSLTLALKRCNEFIFPTKNALYNVGGANGHVLTASICLVGIITCADDGGRSRNVDAADLSTVLESLVGGRYRLPPISAKTRLSAFERAFQRENLTLCSRAATQLPLLAASGVAVRGSGFSRVACRLRELSKGKQEASLEDLKYAMLILQEVSSPSSRVEFTGSESETAENGSELFSSVGGNTEAKRAIEEALALDLETRKIFRRFGLSPPTGVLLYGPPGTGKTLLAKAVSRLLKTQGRSLSSVGGAFISLQASEIVRGEVGNSEKMLVAAFETARSNAPSVIFFDEFQALFTERSGSGSGKLASTLLQCMDDVSRWRDADSDANPTLSNEQNSDLNESSRVVVMGATNTPWMVDKAFLRSGRFDRVVHVGLPIPEERVSILRVHVSRMKLVSTESDYVDMICRTLAERCDGFSGADLAALCRAAAVRCLAECGENGRIEDRHFYDACDGFVHSCAPELVQRLTAWRP